MNYILNAVNETISGKGLFRSRLKRAIDTYFLIFFYSKTSFFKPEDWPDDH